MSNRANPAVPDPGARHPALSGTGDRYTGGALQTVAGLLILAMVLLTILDNLASWRFSDPLRWVAGISAWLATLLLIRRATFFLRIQVGILLGAGLGMILLAHGRGAAIDPLSAISTNTGLLSMIAAVGFLRLVALPRPGEVRRLPVGRRAYLQTLASIGVFSSVINISAPVLIADRIHRERPLDRFTTQSVIRVFCGMSNWSPFFGAMAAVLTYVGGARLDLIMLACLPFSLLCVAVVYLEARWRYPDRMIGFVGYPMEREALLVPAMLLLLVAVSAQVFPGISILALIAVCALAVSALLLAVRHGPGEMASRMRDHTLTFLPRMVGELSLFLSAGVFAVGMAAMIDSGLITSPFTRFDGVTAAQLLCLMLVAALVGIHPIILVSSLTPMVMALDPNPTLLAIVYLTAWNLGTGSSYLSGTQLIFQGRYGIPSWKSASWNWPYALVMFLLASGWLLVLSRFLT